MGKKRCQVCNKIFTTNNDLWDHKNKNHSLVPTSLSCDLCDFKTMSKRVLRMHKKQVHSEPQKCDLCGIKTKYLKAHERSIFHLNKLKASATETESSTALKAASKVEEEPEPDPAKKYEKRLKAIYNIVTKEVDICATGDTYVDDAKGFTSYPDTVRFGYAEITPKPFQDLLNEGKSMINLNDINSKD